MKVWGLESPPPGDGFKTVSIAVRSFGGDFLSISCAEIVAVSLVLLMYLVGRSDPSQRIRDVGTKFVPVTISVNESPPDLLDAGSREEIVGTGLRIVKVWAFEVPLRLVLYLLKTATAIVPPVLRSLAAIDVVNAELLT